MADGDFTPEGGEGGPSDSGGLSNRPDVAEARGLRGPEGGGKPSDSGGGKPSDSGGGKPSDSGGGKPDGPAHGKGGGESTSTNLPGSRPSGGSEMGANLADGSRLGGTGPKPEHNRDDPGKPPGGGGEPEKPRANYSDGAIEAGGSGIVSDPAPAVGDKQDRSASDNADNGARHTPSGPAQQMGDKIADESARDSKEAAMWGTSEARRSSWIADGVIKNLERVTAELRDQELDNAIKHAIQRVQETESESRSQGQK